jgi:hypothetical protein
MGAVLETKTWYRRQFQHPDLGYGNLPVPTLLNVTKKSDKNQAEGGVCAQPEE